MRFGWNLEVGTVKRICLCEPEIEHTLKHREQTNNRGVEWELEINNKLRYKVRKIDSSSGRRKFIIEVQRKIIKNSKKSE
jgi:hypothetical protein